MNLLPKFVVSTTLKDPSWQNTTVISHDVPGAVSALKQQPGQDILVGGSATLVQTLIEHGLVDEFRLLTFPVVLGSGKRLFGEGCRVTMTLAEVRTLGPGVVLQRYLPVPER